MSQATPLPKPNLIASLTMFPVGMGTSVSEQVGKAYQSIKGIDGINVEPNSMSTIIEANSLEKIWEAVSAAPVADPRDRSPRRAVQSGRE